MLDRPWTNGSAKQGSANWKIDTVFYIFKNIEGLLQIWVVITQVDDLEYVHIWI